MSNTPPPRANRFPTPPRTARRDRAQPAPAWVRSAKLHIQVPSRPGVVLVVAAEKIWHIPADADGVNLTLCPQYDSHLRNHNATANAAAAAPLQGAPPSVTTAPVVATLGPPALIASADPCPLGARCAFVHGDVRGATEYIPHIRDIATRFAATDGDGAAAAMLLSAEGGPYARYPAGAVVQLARPNETAIYHEVPSEQLLRTRALDGSRRPVSHCVHFFTKGRCDRGPLCQFAHHLPLPGDDVPPPRLEDAPTSADPQRRPRSRHRGRGRRS
uniref:C3H1-type domain-containing protein n=1 Tax=Neobodo designis TaxID=312471 RepID=A0A6U4X619_NEODS|mmetsp:Transcript_52586/g.161848  ORF Transcript_52586/g.161848 Transcript_52586/m.161848 type:complete len:273 (+) Transcript_52586:1595-2413(+)